MPGGFCVSVRLFLRNLIRTPTRIALLTLYLLILFAARNLIREILFQDSVRQIFLGGPQKERELIQLHVIFKHGHRAPFRLYETDPNPRSLWEEGLGALTKLGRYQMYITGQQLRSRYSDFLTSNPAEIYVQSSDASRSLYSSYSFLAGYYPPGDEWSFLPELPWQPIEVHYVPEEHEKYLQSNPNCPLYEASKHRTASSKEIKKFIDDHKWYYEFWNKHSQKRVGTYDGAGDLFKTLSVEKDMNLTIPDWAEQYWDELVHQADVGYFFHFHTRLQQRLRAGPLLGLILNRMHDRIEAINIEIKTYAYSGHGSNIAAIQCALQSYDMKHAPHAATLVQELYREGAGFYSTRFLLFNSTHPESIFDPPFAIHLHGCPSEFCPLDIYEDKIRDLIPDDWESECQVDLKKIADMTPLQYPVMIPS